MGNGSSWKVNFFAKSTNSANQHLVGFYKTFIYIFVEKMRNYYHHWNMFLIFLIRSFGSFHKGKKYWKIFINFGITTFIINYQGKEVWYLYWYISSGCFFHLNTYQHDSRWEISRPFPELKASLAAARSILLTLYIVSQ